MLRILDHQRATADQDQRIRNFLLSSTARRGLLDKVPNDEILHRIGKPPNSRSTSLSTENRGKPPLRYLKQTAAILSNIREQISAEWGINRKAWHYRTAAYHEGDHD